MSAKAKGHATKGKAPVVKGVRADGLPRLPPIPKSVLKKEDPYATSKLLTYRAAKEKQNLLTKIMLGNAVKAYDGTVEHNRREEQSATNNEPAYPAQVLPLV